MSEIPSSMDMLLRELADELRRRGVWAGEPPSPAALSSRLPFCCDTLSFTEWLQWVLIPRLEDLDRHGGHWPAHSAMRPMAEESLAGCDWTTRDTIELIGRVDALINARGAGKGGA